MLEIGVDNSAGSFSAGAVRNKTGGADIRLTYPALGKLRSRKVVSRSNARMTGKYPSWKMGRMIQWESVHERNACRRLDADPRVCRFHEQPLMLEYTFNGEFHKHFPDFLIEWLDGSKELWEVKSRKDARREEFVARTHLLEAALQNYGYRYRLMIGEDFAQEPQLSNALKILKFGRSPIPDLARERVRQLLTVTRGITWQAAVSGTLGPHGCETLCRLTLEGFLTYDDSQPWSRATCFEWAAQDREVCG